MTTRLRGIFDKLRGKDASEPDRSEVFYRDAGVVGENPPRILITSFGIGRDEKLELLNRSASIYVRKGYRPILVTTQLDCAILIRSPHAIEMLPERTDLGSFTNESFRQYVQTRWKIIIAKWQADKQIDLGDDFYAYYSDC